MGIKDESYFDRESNTLLKTGNRIMSYVRKGTVQHSLDMAEGM